MCKGRALHLLLRSQLYLWGSTIMVRFLCMWLFLFFVFPTIEVVTFHLYGWCMLGGFSLPAFTRLGHECQGLLSWHNRMHVFTDDLGLYSHPKVFSGMESEPMLTPRVEKTLYRRPRGGLNLWSCIMQDSKPNTLPFELLWPPGWALTRYFTVIT